MVTETSTRRRPLLSAVTRLGPASLAAAATAAAYLLLTVAGRLQPFYDRYPLLEDMWGMYANFYAYLRSVVAGHAGLTFSWSGQLGTNFAGIFTYYLSSPFGVVVLAFDQRHIPAGIELMTGLKLVAAAAAMAWFLRSVAPDRRWLPAAFAVAYALMSYDIVYAQNVMWLDATYLLPLLCLAVDRLLAGRGPVLLAVVLVVLMTTTFYTAYAAVLFGAGYLLVRLVVRSDQAWLRRAARMIGWYVGLTVLAVGTAAVLLLPMLEQARHRGPRELPSHGLWPLQPSIPTLLGKHLTGAYDAFDFTGTPNVSVGILMLVGVALFFAVRSIRARERLAYAALLFALFLSLVVPWLTFAWQGFSDANWYPARFSFVYSFLLVLLAFRGCDQAFRARVPADRFRVALPVAAVGLIPAGSIIAGAHRAAAPADLVLCVLAALGVWGWHRRPWPGRLGRGKVVTGVLAAAIALDATASALLIERDLAPLYPAASGWRDAGRQLQSLVTQAKAMSPSGRILNLAGATFNDDYRYGYSGVGAESTFMAGQTYQLLRGLGFTASITGLQTADIGGTPLSSAVLSLGAVITPLAPPNPATMGLPSNPPPLPAAVSAQPDVAPVGYVLAPSALGPIQRTRLTPTTNPFSLAELLLGAKPGTIAQPVRVLNTHFNNIALTHPRHPRFERIDGTRAGAITWTLDAPPGRHVYGFVGTDHPFRLALAVNGGATYDYPSPLNNGAIDLGEHAGPTRVTLRLDHFARWVPADPVFVSLDQAALHRRVTQLQADGLTSVVRGVSSLQAALTSPGGTLVVTIPYDSGWHVRLDGHTVRATSLQGLVAVPAPPGPHRLSMAYVQPGLRRGAALSLAGLLALLLVVGYDARRRRRASQFVEAGADVLEPVSRGT